MKPKPTEPWLYHGTTPLKAVCIAADGFRLLDPSMRVWGRGCLGDGIYATIDPSMALWFAAENKYLLRVRVTGGTRLLRIDGGYDQRIIDSLRREFGKEILKAEFDSAIPKNKQLTRDEISNLFNYLWSKKLLGLHSDEHRQVRRDLTRFRYHGMGEPTTDVGIVLFNPSRLTVDKVCRSSQSGSIIEAKPDTLLLDAAGGFLHQLQSYQYREQTLKNLRDAGHKEAIELAAEQSTWGRELRRAQKCLRRYAEREGLRTTSDDIQRAIESNLSAAN